MRVLVTGALGMVGASVLRELLAGGHEPVAIDVGDDTSLVSDLAGEYEGHVVDIRDLDRLTEFASGVDAIAQLAALLPAERDPFSGYAVNALGPVGVFEAARRAGVARVVWSSAKAVYGRIAGEYGFPAYAPVPEDHPRGTLPAAPVYSVSKLLAEEAGRHYARAFGIEVIALRFATIFGPGKVAPRGTGVVGGIVAAALHGDSIRLSQGADERDELIYVRDVARGVVAALQAPAPPSWVYNIGSGILVSLPEFAEAVRGAVGPVRFEIGPGRDPFGIGCMYGILDGSRARHELGYEPAWSLDAALRDFAQALQDGGATHRTWGGHPSSA